jgi:two-component system nitrogen regulation sensor histidine kinase NtrY
MVNAEAAIPVESPRPRWRRRISVFARRSAWVPVAEICIVLLLLAVLAGSYLVIIRASSPESPLSPEMVAALVVANLVPAMALMVMIARRLAIRRAMASDVGGKGRLHVRLVALFSIIASVPTLLVVVFASVLFQSGVKFWFSDESQTVLASAERVATIYTREHRDRVERDVRVMGGDIVDRINRYGLGTPRFLDEFLYQVGGRDLNEAALLRIDESGRVQNYVVEVNFDNRPLASRFPASVLQAMRAGDIRFSSTPDRVEAVVRLDPEALVFLYGARKLDAAAVRSVREAQTAASDYQRTLESTRRLQVRFNVILILVSLALIGLSIWIALALADRIVRPIGQLVDAARRVTAGDLAARVPTSNARDEVGTLGSTFNRMTRRLEEQTGALVAANAQLDTRRAFTEAVLSGVTAGVISVDDDHVVRLINSSAEALLKTGGKSPVGQKLADLVPELDRQLTAAEREDVVQVASTGEPRTLAVKTVKVKNGHVLTFDDITEQLMDQRRAAWSDVARRIAHEIKNPLTPIQLAAERLQRRYGNEVTSDQATFERLTGTIVRQVGDLRRMVDEFSSFARMPKPAFAPESLGEIARGALFLHEVAHPDIAFSLDCPDPAPILVCDRRLLGQALTNVVKNGVEAIQQKQEEKKRRRGGPDGVSVRIQEERSRVTIEILDTGVGLPAERARMTEPYMTTRAKGTGLGLAIVKKIVEEHFGQIEFEDAPGGGSLVRMMFDRETLAHLADNGPSPSEDVSASG